MSGKKGLYLAIAAIGISAVVVLIFTVFSPKKTILTEDSLKKRISTDPYDVGDRMKLLNIYIEKGKTEEAKELASSTIRSIEDMEATTLKRLVDISLSTRDASSLSIYLPQLLTLKPSKRYYDIYFDVLKGQKRLPRTAIPIYASYISRYPTDTERIKQYERLLADFGLYNDVKDVYEKYHDIVGNDVEFEHLAFQSLKSLGDYTNASSIARHLLDSIYGKEVLRFLIEDAKRNGENGKLMSYYEEYLSREFDPKMAIEYIDLCISNGKDFYSIVRDVKDVGFLKRLSSHLEDRGDIADAIGVMRIALSHDPTDTKMYLDLSDMLLNIGDIRDARDYALSILKVHHDDPAVHLVLARCYLASGEYENARMEIEKIPKERRTPDILYYLGVIDMKEGNYDNALKIFIGSYNMHPSLENGKKLLLVARLRNDEHIFRRYLSRISIHYPTDPEISEWKERLSILDDYIAEKKVIKKVVKYGERVWYYLETQFPNAKPIKLMRLVKEIEFLNPFIYDVDHILPGDQIYIPVEE